MMRKKTHQRNPSTYPRPKIKLSVVTHRQSEAFRVTHASFLPPPVNKWACGRMCCGFIYDHSRSVLPPWICADDFWSGDTRRWVIALRPKTSQRPDRSLHPNPSSDSHEQCLRERKRKCEIYVVRDTAALTDVLWKGFMGSFIRAYTCK